MAKPTLAPEKLCIPQRGGKKRTSVCKNGGNGQFSPTPPLLKPFTAPMPKGPLVFPRILGDKDVKKMKNNERKR